MSAMRYTTKAASPTPLPGAASKPVSQPALTPKEQPKREPESAHRRHAARMHGMLWGLMVGALASYLYFGATADTAFREAGKIHSDGVMVGKALESQK